MNLDEIKNIINKYKNRIIIKGRNDSNYKSNKLLFEEINKNYIGKFKNISEIIYLIKNYNNLENLHLFCYCGNKNQFNNPYMGYNHHCSTRCSTLDPQVKLKNKKTMMARYNVEHNWKSKNPKLNGLETRNKKYINGNYNNRIKAKETCLNNIDSKGLNVYQRAVIKNKKTKLQRYGNENYSNTQQMLLIRKKIDKDGMNSYQRGAIKTKHTCLRKYKVSNISKTQYFKDFLKEHRQEIQNKIYLTMKKNNSFGKSNSEETIYQELLKKFSKEDIIRQYKSKEYPFRCDFYIKSKDLYIEYNGHFTHGKEPFDNNNIVHIKILNKWKSRNTKYYNTAVYVWTITDVKKIECFKKNNLNYKIFYNLEQFYQWYKEYSIQNT